MGYDRGKRNRAGDSYGIRLRNQREFAMRNGGKTGSATIGSVWMNW